MYPNVTKARVYHCHKMLLRRREQPLCSGALVTWDLNFLL